MLYSRVENSDWSCIAKQAHIQMHNKQWFIADTIQMTNKRNSQKTWIICALLINNLNVLLFRTQ